MKACKNENKKIIYYCCLKIYVPDTDCCEHALAPDRVEYWDFGDMDVHGTALILEGGRASSFPVTSDGKHMFCSMISISRLKGDIRSYRHRYLNQPGANGIDDLGPYDRQNTVADRFDRAFGSHHHDQQYNTDDP